MSISTVEVKEELDENREIKANGCLSCSQNLPIRLASMLFGPVASMENDPV